MVTGASRGIGREIARRFSDNGARVVVHFHKNSQAAERTLNRVVRPEEVARVVLFLAAEGTDYLTGSIIDVNGASYLRS